MRLGSDASVARFAKGEPGIGRRNTADPGSAARNRATVLACVLLALSESALAESAPLFKRSMEVGIEGRVFVEDAADASQKDGGVSVFVEPELDYGIARGNLRLVPFARWDSQDDQRSHVDIREATIRQRYGDWDLLAGIGRVFWGATESIHLVDIINQTDLVENPDGEDKLGQPMLSLSWTTSLGSFTGYVLPGFRDQLLPGEKARLRAPLPFDTDDAIYESGAERRHVDAAVRWSLSRGAFDIGLSHFSGTARAPRFELGFEGGVEGGIEGAIPLLVPVYMQVDQTGLDLSVVQGGWLLKLEAIHNQNRLRDYSAAAGGFEYTFASVGGSAWDVGALAEYLWDERGEADDLATAFASAFQNDLFIGSRLAANDVAGTEILIGSIVDLDSGGTYGNLEASRRLGPSGKLTIELRVFAASRSPDPFFVYKQDDYLQLEYVHYF